MLGGIPLRVFIYIYICKYNTPNATHVYINVFFCQLFFWRQNFALVAGLSTASWLIQGAYAPVMWRVWAGGAEAPQGTQKKNSRAGNRKPKTRLPRTKVSLNLTNDTVHLFVSRMWDWDRVWSGSVN